MSLRRAVWILPLAFLVHDGEEIATMPRWIAGNRAALDRVADAGPLARRLVENLPTTTGAVAAAVGVELVLIVAATTLLSRRPRPGFGVYLYAGILGALFLHVLTHVAQAIVFRGYTPGVVSAVVVIPPASVYLYRRLFAARLLTRRLAAASAAVGAAAALPLVASAHYLGRALWRA